MPAQSVISSALSAVVGVITEVTAPDSGESGADRAEPAVEVGVGLRAVWAEIPDPCDRRGRRHSLAVMFALVQAAIVSGATTFAAIGHWIGAAPEQVLEGVGARRDRRTGRPRAPHPDTVCRTLAQVDPAQVDAAYARYQAAQVADLYDDAEELIAVTVDGKSQRGTATGTATGIGTATPSGGGTGKGRAQHRLGAMLADDAITLAQVDVDGKTNELFGPRAAPWRAENRLVVGRVDAV